MVKITNDENYLDHSVEVDAVEGPQDCVGIDEVPQVSNKMKTV